MGTHRPRSAWYKSDLRAMKREKRQAEGKFRNHDLRSTSNFLRSRVLLIIACLNQPSVVTISKKIENSNTKQLFRMIDGFFTVRSPVIPTHDSLAHLVENFNDFFIQRIHGFRRELDRVPKATTCSFMIDKEAPQIIISFQV